MNYVYFYKKKTNENPDVAFPKRIYDTFDVKGDFFTFCGVTVGYWLSCREDDKIVVVAYSSAQATIPEILLYEV